MKSLEDQLREAIRKRPETEHAVAMAAGVSPPILNRFMRGERGLNMATADRLCRYLGLSLKR